MFRVIKCRHHDCVCFSTCYTCSRKAAGWTGWWYCWSVACSSAPAPCCSLALPADTYKDCLATIVELRGEKWLQLRRELCRTFLWSELTWLKRCGSTASGRPLVSPDSWGTDTTSDYWKTAGIRSVLVNMYVQPNTNMILARTLVAAQSIQPLPLGSIFSRTKPSTMSGKINWTQKRYIHHWNTFETVPKATNTHREKTLLTTSFWTSNLNTGSCMINESGGDLQQT